MDPFTIGLILSGVSGLYGAHSKSKMAKQQQRRQDQYASEARGLMSQGPGEAEQMMMEWLTNGGEGFDPSHLFSGEGYNSGQDALMQMLRAEPFDTSELGMALEPIEARALEESLSGGWAGASGLGQRFGSAAMREEGRVRQQSGEGAAARRAEMARSSHESAADRALGAGQTLTQAGLAESELGLQSLMQLFGMGQGRQSNNLGILQSIYGQQPTDAGSPYADFGGELGQLLALLPLLKSLNAGGGGMKPA